MKIGKNLVLNNFHKNTKVRIFFFLSIAPSLFCMDLSDKKDKNLAPFFKIFMHMNELDLEKPGYVNKAEFGERIGYLMGYPLEYWKMPETEIEQKITLTWVQKLYAYKDDQIFHYMIEDIFFKIVKHEQLYTCILNLLEPDEEMEEQEELVTYFYFKRAECLVHQQIQKKNGIWGWSQCIIL